MDIKVNKSEIFYMSSDNETQIHALKWLPNSNIKAIIQIAHGMSEYIDRYDNFAKYLASNGYIVCGNDHLGHGQSVISKDKYGYFGKNNGWQNLVDDMHKLSTLIKKDKKEYKGLPYILIGHSMGSLLARQFCTLYSDELLMAILMGTNGGNPLIDFGIKLCEKKIAQEGILVRADDINKIAFGRYNKKAYPRHSDYDWLSRDTNEVDKFVNDPLCGITFTYGGFLDLFKLVKEVSGKKWAAKIPLELPMYFLSGNMDPVGNYSHGVVKVVDWLTSTNHKNVSIKFYEDARHELLNEINREEVYKDILKIIDKVVKAHNSLN